MDCPIEPFDDRVVVQKEGADETSHGGIIIPEMAKEPTQMATVVAVGPGLRKDDGERVPMGISAGDKVFVGKYAGVECEIKGEKYNVIREADCLGRVKAS